MRQGRCGAPLAQCPPQQYQHFIGPLRPMLSTPPSCMPPLPLRAQVLASLVDSHNNILVPGFYANVRPNMLQASWGPKPGHGWLLGRVFVQ